MGSEFLNYFWCILSGMPSPAPITWWPLPGDSLAIFNKPQGLPVLFFGEEGDSLIELQLSQRVLVPIFTLSNPSPSTESQSLIQQIQTRLDFMFEEGSRLGEGGRFHAVFKSLESDYLQGDRLTLGLAYCTEDLIPAFVNEAWDSSTSRPTIPQIPIKGCDLAWLPSWVESPYMGPRPSRYKRKLVI